MNGSWKIHVQMKYGTIASEYFTNFARNKNESLDIQIARGIKIEAGKHCNAQSPNCRILNKDREMIIQGCERGKSARGISRFPK
jgi:hypothetical protein